MKEISRLKNFLETLLNVEVSEEKAGKIFSFVCLCHAADAVLDVGGRGVEIFFNETAKNINEGNRKRGFWEAFDKYKGEKELKNAFISQFIMLVNTELSEAVEALREDNIVQPFDRMQLNEMLAAKQSFKTSFKLTIKDKFEDEIADAIIRLLDLAGGLNIDIGYFIAQKLKYNSTREYKHGKQM